MTIAEKLIVLSKINDLDRLRLGLLLILDEVDYERGKNGAWLDNIIGRATPLNPGREAA